MNGQWQSWNVSGGDIDVNGDNGGTTTLAAYAAAHPGAKLVNTRSTRPTTPARSRWSPAARYGGDTDPQTSGEYFVDRVIVGARRHQTRSTTSVAATRPPARTTALTVDPDNARGWQHQAYDNDDYLESNQDFVDGPGHPARRRGSLQFTLTRYQRPAVSSSSAPRSTTARCCATCAR